MDDAVLEDSLPLEATSALGSVSGGPCDRLGPFG